MTDIRITANNDIDIVAGQFVLIADKEVLTLQRILNKLRSFTGTLFTNVNYGIDQKLLWTKGSKTLLDSHLATLISQTNGVVRITEFSSEVNPVTRIYSVNFKCEIETGDIIGIKGLSIGSGGITSIRDGVWRNGQFEYVGLWDKDEVWGSN